MEGRRALLDEQKEWALYAVATHPAYWRNAMNDAAEAGWYGALVDARAPVTLISFHQLEDEDQLKRYAVVILPHTGKVDENRGRRESGLGEWWDLGWWKPTREQLLRRYKFEGGYDPEGRRPLSRSYELCQRWVGGVGGEFPQLGSGVQPTYVGHQAPGGSWSVVAEVVASDEERALMPLPAVREAGAGRMVFSSASWGHQDYERRDGALEAWMARVVGWLGRGKEL